MLFIRIGVFLLSHYGEFQSIYICPEIHGPAIKNKINRILNYKVNLKQTNKQETLDKERDLLLLLILTKNNIYVLWSKIFLSSLKLK